MIADHVEPFAVADRAGRWPHRIDTMFPEPLVDIKKEKLFAPQHPGQRLAHDIGRIFPDASRRDRLVELVGLAPAAIYFYSPDRGGEHPATHLAHFMGFLQADAYSGFKALYEPRKASPGFPAMPAITEVACWAHCRRGIFDVWQTTKSTVAKAALDRIAQFYAIEDKARFAPPDERLAHRTATIPLLDAFFTWAQVAERKLSARSELAEALRYIIKRRTALTRFATDARLEADNNIAENAIRSIALGRRNWLFAGSHSGGERAAAMYSILQTAKLNGINPEAYLTDIFSRIAAGHPISRISELMPWAFQSPRRDPAA
jgi:transposase